MRSIVRNPSAVPSRISSGLRPAIAVLGLLALCALAPAALITVKEERGALPAARATRVSLAGLDLSTPDGARERISKAARTLCAGNPATRPLDWCVNAVVAAAQREIRARTLKVDLEDLDLRTPQGVQVARERLEAAARRVCQEPQPGGEFASTRTAACVDQMLVRALRQVEVLQRISVDF